MNNLVYSYSKGLEVLNLPLSGTPTYGFVLAFSFWTTVGTVLLAGHIGGRNGGKPWLCGQPLYVLPFRAL